MKTAVGIGAAVLAALLLSLFMSGERNPTDDVVTQAETAVTEETPSGSVGVTPEVEGPSTEDVAFEPVQSLPDLELQMSPPDESETPPRTVAGLPAVERSVELPVVDPDTIEYDPGAGSIDIPAPEPRPDSGFSPGPQIVVDNDGPLGGVLPQPDPTVPGPSVIEGSSVDRIPSPDEVGEVGGPGVPLDSDTAAGMDPMFRVPEEGEIDDPDDSPE